LSSYAYKSPFYADFPRHGSSSTLNFHKSDHRIQAHFIFTFRYGMETLIVRKCQFSTSDTLHARRLEKSVRWLCWLVELELFSRWSGTADLWMCTSFVAVTSQSICIIAILPTGGCIVSAHTHVLDPSDSSNISSIAITHGNHSPGTEKFSEMFLALQRFSPCCGYPGHAYIMHH